MKIFDKILGKKENSLPSIPTEKNTVYAPVSGNLIVLVDFPDEAFSEGVLGPGCGIEPNEEIINAPFEGEVVQLHDSQHALGLLSNDGVELLIHVGIDTVSMKGKGFKALIKEGDKFVTGQNLLKFSIAEIQKAGFNTAIAVIITNSGDYETVNVVPPGVVSVGSPIIRLFGKAGG